MDPNKVIDNFDENTDGEATAAPQPPIRPAQPTPSPRPAAAEQPQSEKMEFLKRDEIQTMQRDISKLRESEAIKERERIANINPGRGFVRPPDVQEQPMPAAEGRPPLPPQEETTKKPSSLPKILIRIALVIFVLAAAGFAYWFLAVRTTPPEEIIPTETATTTEPVATTTEAVIPPALFAVDGTETLRMIDVTTETNPALASILSIPFPDNIFNRILLIGEGASQYIGLREFFNLLPMVAPQNVLEKLDNEFTLFVYSNKGVNRLGFVARISDQTGLTDAISSWESTMEADTTSLFNLLGKTGSGPTAAFKSATKTGVTFRYLSFKPDNLGICWAITGDRFIFTSSGEAMIKTIDKLAQ
jgi:hypothetical protein